LLHAECEAGGEWIDRFLELVSVERHCGLEPKGVSASESGRQQSRRGSRLDQCFPKAKSLIGRNDNLVTILARIAGAADDRRLPRDRTLDR
jgi:hypothetical protein